MSVLIGAVVALVAAFGGAWYGGRFQRASNMETLDRQVQIDSAAKFIGAVGEAQIGFAHTARSIGEDLTLTEQTEPAWLALIGLRVRAAAITIVGPEDLAELAKEMLEQAMRFDYVHIQRPEGWEDEALVVWQRFGRLAQEFEEKAVELFRRNPGQKNGRKPLRRPKVRGA